MEIPGLESTDSLKEFLEQLSKEHAKSGSALPPSITQLYIANFNKAIFTFTRRNGAKYYPEVAGIYFNKHATPQRSSNVGAYERYGSINTSYYGIQPFENMFIGSNQNEDRPVYSFHFYFPTYLGFPTEVKSIHFKTLEKWNSSSTASRTPEVVMREYWFENGAIKVKDWINEHQPSDTTSDKQYDFPL